jgi:GTP:adenosylcobinamide-phosphate guanylyltransferase
VADGFTVLVLAAQRAGVDNPLAVRAGVSHKCLVRICGKPLIAHVLDTLTTMPGVGLIRISVEPEAVPELTTLIAAYAPAGVPIDFAPSDSNIAESVIAASAGVPSPILITTADNVLLSHDSLRRMLDAFAGGADAAAALTTRGAIHAVHPEGQRRFYEFRDDAYSNCNLYGLSGPHALAGVEVFREGGQFAKNPKRLITAFGLINILLMRFKLVSIHGAMKRASRRFGLKMAAVVLADGSQAIDVDNERTYAIAEGVLAKKLGL